MVPTSGYSVLLNAELAYDLFAVEEFISQGNSSGSGFYIGQHGAEMRITDNYGQTATPSIGGCCSGVATEQDGLWHNCALVVTGSDAEFFIDGISRATRAGFSIGSGSNFTRLSQQFNEGEQFTWELSDVRIYDGALLAALAGAGVIFRRRQIV